MQQFLKAGLRWCALPFVFMGAILIGCWMWWVFIHIPVAACPPPLASYAQDPTSVTCGLLLGARLLLDIGGASMPGLMAVFLCALVAPAQRPLVAGTAALGVSALGLVYLLLTLSQRSPMKLPVRADLLALAASPWLTVWLVVRLDRQPRRRLGAWGAAAPAAPPTAEQHTRESKKCDGNALIFRITTLQSPVVILRYLIFW